MMKQELPRGSCTKFKALLETLSDKSVKKVFLVSKLEMSIRGLKQ